MKSNPRKNFPVVKRCVLALMFLLAWSNGADAGEPRVYRDKVAPHWFANQTRFWYRNELPNGAREFIVVDAQHGTRQPAFDHARVAEALGKLLGRSVDGGPTADRTARV